MNKKHWRKKQYTILILIKVNTEPKKSRLFHLDVVISKVTVETIWYMFKCTVNCTFDRANPEYEHTRCQFFLRV